MAGSTPATPFEANDEPLLELDEGDMDENEGYESSQEVHEVASRSVGDLQTTMQLKVPTLKRSRSFNSVAVKPVDTRNNDTQPDADDNDSALTRSASKAIGARREALEMRQRSAQKTFIRVEISRFVPLPSLTTLTDSYCTVFIYS
jgi:hypothetical protein